MLTSFQTALLAHPVAIASYYQTLSVQGLNYGEQFQVIQQLWQQSGQALSQLRLAGDSLADESYALHPALLDGCFQTIGAAVQANTEGTYLPVGLDRLQFYSPLRQSGWCAVKLQRMESNQNGFRPKTLKADLFIWDEAGTLAAQITGMTLKYIGNSSLQRLFGRSVDRPLVPVAQAAQTDSHRWLHEIVWQNVLNSQSSQSLKPGQKQSSKVWLLFLDPQGSNSQNIGEQIAIGLQKKGDRVFKITPSDAYKANPDSDTYSLNPSDPNSFGQLFADLIPILIAENQGELACQIAYLWALDATEKTTGELLEQERICGGLLQLVQALSQSPALSVRLWLLTQNAQFIDTPTPLNLQQSPLWGLARTLRLERPELGCTPIDLSNSFTTKEVELLLQDFCTPDVEEQIAYRQDNRFVARLLPQSEAPQPLTKPENSAFRLGLSSYGVLDDLALFPVERETPKAKEVEIQVKASGLNFRDVLNALGMLQDVLETMGLASPTEVPFGGECAGVVTAVGAGVENLEVGDAVIAAQAVGSLRQFVTVPADFVVAKPVSMSFAEAATVPTTFLTAYYGLVHCAGLKAGDRVLIHSAAGGVGQAAVQIAQSIGAEVFATASPPKWDFLHSMGIQQVMNSRTLDFTEEVLTVTKGKGVDVVFNSLNGEFIDKSVEVLAPQGRFVEIGKIGIWNAEKMSRVRADVGYFPFDLLEVSTEKPQMIAQLLNDLMVQFEAKHFQPLPKTVFPIESAPDAFRYMAQARHIGKVVLTLSAIASHQSLIKPQAAYLVTGGLGALGLNVAQWLAAKGAQHLILLGRRSPAAAAQQTIDKLQQSGVTVQTIQADISERTNIESALSPYLLSDASLPLKGIFHLAGTLEDGLLINQSWQSFAKVISPKLAGAWNLHVLTQSLDLDHFVCFSSIVSLMGSLGQSNYAAANTFLDSLAHHRQSLGLPALSLNWGPWADAGMVAELDERSQNRMADQGLTQISPEIGLQMMADAMTQSRPQVGVVPIDWGKFMTSASGQASGASLPLLSALKPAATEPTACAHSDVLQQLARSEAGDRAQMLAAYLQLQLAKVMGFSSPKAINPNEQFGDLGMDSLMAVEFSNRLQKNLNYPIPQTLTFDYPTVNALAGYLSEKISPELASVQAETSVLEGRYIAPSVPAAKKEETAEKIEHNGNDNGSESAFRNADGNANGAAPQLVFQELPAYEPPAEHYTFSRMPDYRRLRQDLDRVEDLGNPFFTVHEGTAKDTTRIDGRSLINYASYNYLGLSGDPRLNEAAQRAIAQYGTSVSASRVVSGERPVHQQLEKGLADFLGTEDCITYIGGHATNVTTIGHLFQEKDLILYDALSHNSIREGCNLAGATAIEFLP